MNLTAWVFQKTLRSTKRPASIGTIITCKIKDDCDVENPVFELTRANYAGYNYFKCNLEGRERYYYVKSIKLLTNSILEVSCTEDYLATYKDVITGQFAYNYIERCTDFGIYQSAGRFITDSERDVKYNKKSTTEYNLLDIAKNGNLNNRLYLIGLVGSQNYTSDPADSYDSTVIWDSGDKLGLNVDAFCTRYGVSYYLIDGNALNGLVGTLQGIIEALMNSWASNMDKYLSNVFKSIIVLPITLRTDGTHKYLGDSGIEVYWRSLAFTFRDSVIGADQTVGFQCYSLYPQSHTRTQSDWSNRAKSNGVIKNLINQDIVLPNHPDSALWEGTTRVMCREYLNYAPYNRLELRVPFSNTVEINPKEIGASTWDALNQKYNYPVTITGDYDPVECALLIRIKSGSDLIKEQYNVFGWKTSFNVDGNDTNLISTLMRLVGSVGSLVVGNVVGAGASLASAGGEFVSSQLSSKGVSGSAMQTNSEIDTEALSNITCIQTYSELTDVINEFGNPIHDFKSLYGITECGVKMRNAHFDMDWLTSERDAVTTLCNNGIFIE